MFDDAVPCEKKERGDLVHDQESLYTTGVDRLLV
jgi:hypothetical protein